MFKVELELDKDKIIQEHIYDYNEISNTLDAAFESVGIPNISNKENIKLYAATGKNDNFGNYWIILGALEELDWFVSNVKKLLWYNESSLNKSEHYIDDILQEILDEKETTYAEKVYQSL